MSGFGFSGGGGGGAPVNSQPISGDTVITSSANSLIYADTSSNPIDVTLPAGTDGQIIRIIDVGDNAGNNTITIIGTVDGAVNPTIEADSGSLEVTYINSAWETSGGFNNFFERDGATSTIKPKNPDTLTANKVQAGDTGVTFSGTVANGDFNNNVGVNVDEEASDYGNVFTIDVTKFHTDQTNNTTPSPYVASNSNGDSSAYLAFLAGNGNNLSRRDWWQMDNGSAISVAKVKIITASAGITADQANYIIVQGSDDGVTFNDVYTNTNSGISGNNQTFEFEFAPQSFRYWRLDFSNSNSAGGFIRVINFFSGSYATAGNTFEYRPLTAGGSTIFAPSTFGGTDDGDIPLANGEVLVEYSTDNGSTWPSGQLSLSAFQALGNITGTSFWLRLAMVGANRIKSATIQTSASFAEMTSQAFDVQVENQSVFKATPDGVEIPRLTTAERLALPSPQISIVFDTDLNALMSYDGSIWTNNSSGGGGAWGSITGTLSAQTDLQDELVAIKQAQGVLALQQAIANGTPVDSNYLYIRDEFHTNTGVLTTNMNYSSANDTYRTGTTAIPHSLLIQSDADDHALIVPVNGASDFIDASPNNPTLTVTGTAQTLIPNGTTEFDPYGGTEAVCTFDGTDDYIQIDGSGTNSDFDLNTVTTFSFSFWFKTAGTATQFLIEQSGTNNNRSFQFTTDSGGGVNCRFFAETDGVREDLNSSSNGFNDDNWHHFALTRDGSDWYLYIDGVEEDTGTDSGSIQFSNEDWIIGGANTSSDLDGEMADVRYWSGIAKYTSAFTPETSKPVPSDETFYLEHQGTNQAFTDETGSHTPTVVGNVTHSDGSFKFSPSSIEFDGSTRIVVSDSDDWTIDGDYSFEAWVYPTTVAPSDQTICRQWNPTGSNRSFSFRLDGTEMGYASSTNGSSTADNITSSGAGITADEWQHLAWYKEGTTMRMYRNGVRVDESTVSATNHASTADLTIGDTFDASAGFTGYIEEISILKGTARQNSASFTPPTAPYSTSATIVDPELDSIDFTVGTAPTKALAVILIDPVDSITINTDVTVSLSLTSDFADKQDFTFSYAGVDPASGANIYVSDEESLTGLTTGTTLQYFVRGANSKDIIIHGIYIFHAT